MLSELLLEKNSMIKIKGIVMQSIAIMIQNIGSVGVLGKDSDMD